MTADRIAVAFDAAAQHLADDGDRRALVLALVEHMPPEGVAELLARLIKGHPEGAGMAGVFRYSVLTTLLGDRVAYVARDGGRRDGWGVRPVMPAGAGVIRSGPYPTREAAEAALIAAQPVPAAVVRVRE